jgi:uracil-DNA glycosylase
MNTAGAQFNGPSGKALDEHILQPLGITREDAWLSDLRPWSCSNDGQISAISRYHDRINGTKLLRATVERADDVKDTWADATRRAEIMSELRRSGARVLITLGDQPLKHFVHPMGGKCSKLRDLEYGRLTPITLDGLALHLLPLAHPRQIGRLGAHSPEWCERHEAWKANEASEAIKKR